MKGRLLPALLVLVCILAGSTNAAIYVPQVDQYLKFTASAYDHASGSNSNHPNGGSLYGWSPGGEFKFEVYATQADAESGTKLLGEYVTFCAQTSEYINYGAIYKIVSVVASGHDFADWIYWGYLTDEEEGNVVHDRVTASEPGKLDIDADAADLQDALWRALGQTNKGWSNDVYADWQAAYALDTDWRDSAGFEPKVAVLTSVGDHPVGAQDQWVYVDSPSGNIDSAPEPASLLIWSLLGLGSTGMAVWSRRRRNAFVDSGRRGWSRENREAILSIIERGRTP